MTTIHPTAVVGCQVDLGRDVTIGPFCVIEDGAVIGDGCCLAGRVAVKQGTRLGPDNQVAEGAVLGGRPQHLRAGDQVGQLIIGRGNTIRENATIHRGLSQGHNTYVGDNNLIMVNAHVAHDCHVGSHTIIANNVMMAGHVTVGDRAYLSGAVAIHQFCRIGAYAMVGGQAHIKQDVPPYMTVDGHASRIVGLNVIGLRRNGFTNDDLTQLKEAYRVIYRSGMRWTDVLDSLRIQFPTGPAAAFHEFLSTGRRGFLQERRAPRGATLPIATHEEDDAASRELRKVG